MGLETPGPENPSNKADTVAAPDDESDVDADDDAPDSKATDYNSSRSNKADTSAPTD